MYLLEVLVQFDFAVPLLDRGGLLGLPPTGL